jgi:methyl-accepting chemotaxis protein
MIKKNLKPWTYRVCSVAAVAAVALFAMRSAEGAALAAAAAVAGMLLEYRMSRAFQRIGQELARGGDTMMIAGAETSFLMDALKKSIQLELENANEIAVGAEEIARTTEQIAHNADQAARAASETRVQAIGGREAIAVTLEKMRGASRQAERTAEAMSGLQDKAGQIQVIAQVINDIAMRTNLLALNAAIEAARAGEHGRGFAVVAGEVRQLAQKTKSATDDIARMLKEIDADTSSVAGVMDELVIQVTTAAADVEKTGTALDEIGMRADGAEQESGKIAHAVKEHVQATDRITGAIVRIRDGIEKAMGDIQRAADRALVSSDMAENIYDLIAPLGLDTLHDRMRGLAEAGAAGVARLLESAIKEGRASIEDVFDRNYVPIPGTNPQKFTTRFDRLTDELFPTVQEALLESDPAVAYAGAVDSNGYFPTHNRRFAKPLTGDYARDLLNNRTKRIFADRTGLRCAQSTRPHLLQTYKRDTGEVMHDMSVPIRIAGRHWGGFRVGYASAGASAPQTKNTTARTGFATAQRAV